MTDLLLQVNTQECVDCAGHFLARNWSEAVTCAATIISGIIIRAIEKRKMKKDSKKLNN